MVITSTQNKQIKQAVKLRQKKYRLKQRKYLVEGYHMVEEARRARAVDTVYTTDTSIDGDDVVHVSYEILELLSDIASSQAIVAVCNMKDQNELEVKKRILHLEHVQDPGNVGTLIRSAVAFGFDTVVFDESVDPYHSKVLRSTQGAIFHINLLFLSIEEIRSFARNHMIVVADVTGEDFQETTYDDSIILVVGNEGQGLSNKAIQYATKTVTIPMNTVESLNVGVAGSIIMQTINKKLP